MDAPAAVRGGARGQHHRPTAVYAARDVPPPAGQPDTAGDRLHPAGGGVQRTAQPRVRTLGVQGGVDGGNLRGDRYLPAHSHHPGGGGASAPQFGRHRGEGPDAVPVAAVLDGNAHAREPRLGERGEARPAQPPSFLGLGDVLPEQRYERAGAFHELLTCGSRAVPVVCGSRHRRARFPRCPGPGSRPGPGASQAERRGVSLVTATRDQPGLCDGGPNTSTKRRAACTASRSCRTGRPRSCSAFLTRYSTVFLAMCSRPATAETARSSSR